MNWFDVGANLTNKRLFPIGSIVESATKANVTQIAITGTNVAESQQALLLAEHYPEHLVFTVGVHPHDAKDVEHDYIQQLGCLANHPQAVAIGECGLDFNRNYSPQDKQIEVFEAQLELAKSLDMPVFLHERDAFEQQTAILNQHGIHQGVAHCFTGNVEQMQAYLDLGLYIGITGWVCDHKRGQALREAVEQLPLERLLLETDAPYLLPKGLPANTRINVPANLPVVAKTVAELMNVDLAQLAEASYTNACRLFEMGD